MKKECEDYSYNLINGGYTSKEPLGYCSFYKHVGYITENILNKKDCVSKGCAYFTRNEQHPYWVNKNRIKAIKKAKKAGKLTYEFNGKKYLLP